MQAKAVSLWQPWATLVVIGAKRIETRSWQTSYREQMFIHAAKTEQAISNCYAWPFDKYIREPAGLPFGAIIGSVNLVLIESTTMALARLQQSESEQAQEEYRFGNFEHGRFAWRLENPSKLLEPIPMRGRQGIFNIEI